MTGRQLPHGWPVEWRFPARGRSEAVKRVRAVLARADAARVGRLPERQRRVLELRADGLSLARIASELGITRQGAHARERRALLILLEG